MSGSKLAFSVVGLNYKTAPVEIREKVQQTLNTKDLFSQLEKNDSFQGGVLLKTCNRIELYTHGIEAKFENLINNIPTQMNADMMYQKTGTEAVSHLFQVSSSLDSMVIGEPQILGQVKQAYDYSKTHHFISPLLDQIFQKSFFVAKKIRNETSIGKHSVSLSSIAVELTKEFFESLDDKEVLIIGAGEMADVAAKHFQKKNISQIWIANRTYESAVELAKKCHGIPLQFDQFLEKVKDVDIVLTSTGAHEYILNAEQMKAILDVRKKKPLLCIDISVPRNLDPLIHDLQDVYLYGIDDLQNVVDQHIELRSHEAQEALDKINQECNQFVESLYLPSIRDTVGKIQKRVEPVYEQEIRRIMKKMELNAQQIEELRKSFMQLSEKLILNPVLYLQDSKTIEDRKIRIQMVHQIFQIDVDTEESS